MRLAEKLQQEKQSTGPSEDLTARFHAVEQQITKLTSAVERQNGFLQTSDQVISKQIMVAEDRILESITRHFATSSRSSSTNETLETLETQLSEIARTQKLLVNTLDASALNDVASSLKTTTNELRQTTRWNAEEAKTHAEEVEKIGAGAKIVMLQARDAAVAGISEAGTIAADLVTAQLDDATGRAQRVLTVAERFEKGLGWFAAGRMALALLPLATVLLMFVMSTWAVVHAAQWVFEMDAVLWQRILAGVALVGVALGTGFGVWRAAVWLRDKLRWAK